MDNQNLEEQTAAEKVTAAPVETMEDYKDELEASFRKLSEGDLVKGTVISVSEEEITVDLKYFASGIIKAAEFSNDPDFNILESTRVGDEVEATIVKMDDGEGNLLLSKKEANDILAWDKLQEYKDNETELHVRIKGIVPSGVIAYVEGIRGFIPASQLSLEYVEDCNPWLGKEVDVKVITVDANANKLVLSAKAIAREKAQEERNHRINMIAPGSIMEGTVESLMPYGAFVNLGNGLSGLVHISQISEKRIKKPAEVLSEGQKVKVKVLNTNDNKISLSIRALQEEMVDTTSASQEDMEAYVDHESASTNLGDLLSKFKL